MNVAAGDPTFVMMSFLFSCESSWKVEFPITKRQSTWSIFLTTDHIKKLVIHLYRCLWTKTAGTLKSNVEGNNRSLSLPFLISRRSKRAPKQRFTWLSPRKWKALLANTLATVRCALNLLRRLPSSVTSRVTCTICFFMALAGNGNVRTGQRRRPGQETVGDQWDAGQTATAGKTLLTSLLSATLPRVETKWIDFRWCSSLPVVWTRLEKNGRKTCQLVVNTIFVIQKRNYTRESILKFVPN